MKRATVAACWRCWTRWILTRLLRGWMPRNVALTPRQVAAMYDARCPECYEVVAFDPYETDEALVGLHDPFPCPHCGTVIEVDCEDVQGEDGSYEWVYWLTRASVPQPEQRRR